jgi:hypothetical protein
MKKQTLEALATADAKRWAAAEMFYGEGAGTRRKLLTAELGERFDDPLYNELFNNAYEALDMNKFAELAIKERKAIDRAAKTGKNFRALKSGNLSNLSTGVFIIAGVAYVAHQTGYDKIIWAETQKAYKKAKIEVKIWKAKREGRNVERII